MFLLIDNYDSFTYNLYHLLGMLGAELEVVRNDQIALNEALAGAAAASSFPLALAHPTRPEFAWRSQRRRCAIPSRCSAFV